MDWVQPFPVGRVVQRAHSPVAQPVPATRSPQAIEVGTQGRRLPVWCVQNRSQLDSTVAETIPQIPLLATPPAGVAGTGTVL